MVRTCRCLQLLHHPTFLVAQPALHRSHAPTAAMAVASRTMRASWLGCDSDWLPTRAGPCCSRLRRMWPHCRQPGRCLWKNLSVYGHSPQRQS
jgi:hypothetical protein